MYLTNWEQPKKVYLGLAEGEFKTNRFYNHQQSFRNQKYSKSTTLSAHLWNIKRTSNDLQKYNAKFKNKASPCPVHVKGVHEKHQIELVNMRAIFVNYKEKTYKYILLLIDVLSRFHWLCALKRKHSTGIKNKLEKIYSVHCFFFAQNFAKR